MISLVIVEYQKYFETKKIWKQKLKKQNLEMKKLMLGHIFRHAQVVWFHVAKINLRSRRAVEKLGAVLSYEEERELDGKPYTQLYYKLTRVSRGANDH